MFEKTVYVGWSDMDFNAHMKNTAFLDKAADVRMMFFAENGFAVEEFVRRKIGPVIMRDDVDYLRELRMLDLVRITLSMAGLSADGSRFILRNEFWRPDGRLAARITSKGGFLDLSARKLIAAPKALLDALRSLTQTDDFEVLSSSIKPNAGRPADT